MSLAGAALSLESFAKDRAAIIAASDSSQYPASGGDPALQAMQATGLANMMKGTVLRYSYLGDASRIDDPTKNTATITRPDLHQIIYIDMAKRTYRVADLAAAPSDTLSQIKSMLGGMGASMAKGPGSGVMTVKGSHGSLPARQYEGLTLTGTTSTISTAIIKTTGSCPQVDSTVTTATYTAPAIATPKAMQDAKALAVPPMDARNMMGGCRLKQTKIGEPYEMGKASEMYVYRSIQTQGKMKGMAGPSVSIVSERGNIKVLTDADKSLFDIPAGFSKIP
ncbi:MAG: hypothetical protein GIW99_00420 [Candidatus Eremiobacteraeota bacterium]|nr:hypothetical protein [Candidatus Eremiobacteraeota bacterium]MBC5826150.1 hypothetical protein [Candidatus Eremiobacteraeota bacterium]